MFWSPQKRTFPSPTFIFIIHTDQRERGRERGVEPSELLAYLPSRHSSRAKKKKKVNP